MLQTAKLARPQDRNREAPDESHKRRENRLDLDGRRTAPSEDDANLRPLATALLALAEQLLQEERA